MTKGNGWGAVAEKEFDTPELFAAYLRTRSWNCVTAADPRWFQSRFRAGEAKRCTEQRERGHGGVPTGLVKVVERCPRRTVLADQR